MSLLATIQKGRIKSPPRVIVYGQEGIGKSTFGSCAPSPIFIQTEDGLNEIDCERFPLADSYEMFIEQLGALIQEKHDYKNAAIDSLDWLEKLIWARVCKDKSVKSIEDVGYAKGYQFALKYWKEVLDGFDICRANGMGIILIAHAKVEKFNDPEGSAYDRYSLRMHKDSSALLCEWADAVLFATKKIRIEKEDQGFNKTRAIAKPVGADGGERVLRCVWSPACVAKNRYDLPAEIPLLWDEFAKHLTQPKPTQPNEN
jgi:hypothetical protein